MLFSRFFVFAFLGLSLTFSLTGQAQQYHLVQVSPDNDGSEQIKEILSGENEAVVARLKSWVQDIDRVCDLSEEQQKKFRVVIKGASAKRNESRKEELDKQVQRMVGMNQTTAFAVMPKSPRDIDSEKIWTSTLKKILDVGQREKYEAWQEQRKAFQRIALVNNFVSELDQLLFLSPDQRVGLIEIIDEKFGNKLVQIANRATVRRLNGQITPIPEPKYLELVEDLLNESQLAEWKRSVESKLSELR